MTREENKEETRKRLIISALKCFLNNGIESTSMEMVSRNAKVAPRTIYRYFLTKEELVLNASYLFWNEEFVKIQKKIINESFNFDQRNGIEQLKCVLNMYADEFRTNKRWLIVAQEADLFLNKRRVNHKSFTKRINDLREFDAPMWRAVQNGVSDGSIRNDIDIELAYRTMSSGLIGIMQKLAFEYHDIHLETIDATVQLDSYCEIMVSFLKNK